ncbi:MAG: CHASE2 domain-containing protein [Limisphaerales bacterium]
MKLVSPRLIPILIAGLVLALACLCQALRPDLFQRLEWMSYDWRMKESVRFHPPAATNLFGFVSISNESLDVLSNGTLGFQYGLFWPRHIYGRVIRELAREGAKAVGVDVLFGERRPDHAPVEVAPGKEITSDGFLARQLKSASNVVLASTEDVVPTDLFRKNTWSLGDVSNEPDPDGVLRRAKAFQDYRIWDSVIRGVAGVERWKLERARVMGDKIIIPSAGGTNATIRIDKDGYFNPVDLPLDLEEQVQAARRKVQQLHKAFTEERVWHMGIVLAARELNLDLSRSSVDLPHGRITLFGSNGVRRVIPVDGQGRFLIDWTVTLLDPRLRVATFENLLAQDIDREATNNVADSDRFRDRLVVIGSTATGGGLADRGATPLEKDTFFTSHHWNVANAVILDRFIGPPSQAVALLMILALGLASARLTWRLRAVWASGCVLAMAVVYVGVGLYLFVQYRYWLPLVLPVLGSLLMTHVCLVTYRVIFEQNERRRVKSVFAKIVSPNVVNELLGAEKLSLGGARRRMSVFFADVRGFTQMTDDNQFKAVQYVREHNLTGAAAEAHYDASARQTLETVNLYLATIADTIKKHNGTLDKYIGDCVMAFWGAPTPNEQHALACVCAALDAQRAMHAVNQERFAENKRREKENETRATAGLPPLAMLPLLSLGTGINTGEVIVGLMGSDAHILNYTVFGREVNLASRLEGVSGRGRVIIGEATYEEIKRDGPALAATCIEQPPVTVKGISQPVKTYEVPWKQPVQPPAAGLAAPGAAGTSKTGAATAPPPATPPPPAQA